MTDIGNQREVEQRAKAIKTVQGQLDEGFRWLMGDARGRRWVWSLLEKGGVYRSSMGDTPYWTAFNEGRRDMGLHILADVMRLTPTLYPTMQAENAAMKAPKKQTDGGTDGRTDNE